METKLRLIKGGKPSDGSWSVHIDIVSKDGDSVLVSTRNEHAGGIVHRIQRAVVKSLTEWDPFEDDEPDRPKPRRGPE